MYVISYVYNDSWWYIGAKGFYDSLYSDYVIVFASIKEAIDFWEEHKHQYTNYDFPNLAVRKIVYKKKKRLEVPVDVDEDS